jgi:hypothetical protein
MTHIYLPKACAVPATKPPIMMPVKQIMAAIFLPNLKIYILTHEFYFGLIKHYVRWV